jgi:hypothetical protein
LGESVPLVYMSSLEEYVDKACGSLIKWRIYVDTDEALGLQIDLRVNGTDVFSRIDRQMPPWNAFDETAHIWLELLLSELAPGAFENAVALEDPNGGLRESKYVVTPSTWQFNADLLSALLVDGRLRPGALEH